jgi:hypothetical protein
VTAEDPARSGLDHLQVAALELIAAARAFLDVAEDLVREPGAAASVVRTAVSVVGAAARSAVDQDEPPAEPAQPPSGVRRIHVSEE